MYCRTFDCSHRAGAVVGRCCPGIGGNAAIGSIQICQSGAGSDFCRLCWNFGISQLENTQGTSLKRLSCPPPQAILIVKPASRFFYGSALTVHGQPVPLKRAISSERFQASDFKRAISSERFQASDFKRAISRVKLFHRRHQSETIKRFGFCRWSQTVSHQELADLGAKAGQFGMVQ
jgi:hypothetical protein